MSASILDRLNSRIAAEPSLDHLDTIFVDLQDARDAIVSYVVENTDLKDRLSAPPEPAPAPPAAPAVVVPAAETKAPAVTVPGEVRELLLGARERLSVNALFTVADYLDKAIKLME